MVSKREETESQFRDLLPKLMPLTKTIFLQPAGDMCFSGEIQYEVGPACKHSSYLEWLFGCNIQQRGKGGGGNVTCPKQSTYLWRVMGLFGEKWGLSPALYRLYLFP